MDDDEPHWASTESCVHCCGWGSHGAFEPDGANPNDSASVVQGKGTRQPSRPRSFDRTVPTPGREEHGREGRELQGVRALHPDTRRPNPVTPASASAARRACRTQDASGLLPGHTEVSDVCTAWARVNVGNFRCPGREWSLTSGTRWRVGRVSDHSADQAVGAAPAANRHSTPHSLAYSTMKSP
jgi:hypothetical protein